MSVAEDARKKHKETIFFTCICFLHMENLALYGNKTRYLKTIIYTLYFITTVAHPQQYFSELANCAERAHF